MNVFTLYALTVCYCKINAIYYITQVTISLSATLNALKDAINSNPSLGPIKREQQRLFHLGRELKTGSRSLSALGVGKHNVFSIHLHSLAPKTVDLQEEDSDDDAKKKDKSVRRRNKPTNNSSNAVVDLAGPSGGGGNNGFQQQQQRGGQEKVVDLLDSDSDDDDIEVVETVPKRRRGD